MEVSLTGSARCSAFSPALTRRPTGSLLVRPAFLSFRSFSSSSLCPPLSPLTSSVDILPRRRGHRPNGTVVPVTVVGFREGNIVSQVKTAATDGYDAVQVGYRRVRDRKLTKPELGHLEKAGAIPMRHLQEFRLQSVDGFEPGQRLIVEDIFKEDDLVDVSGNSIGKGFQGGIKRHNFRAVPGKPGNLLRITPAKIVGKNIPKN
ncbi:hypothetical protein OPV22_014907 [Ensete ventricosum]|uniref:Large ribosomal subunit protein uL3c n=1 Tax=Ensete ventricosum TaxID=4639 RepID=A0AAV8RCX9_ENSVE|nr:hypothetical protein OPV22_014907 [Ensete ventricosum]